MVEQLFNTLLQLISLFLNPLILIPIIIICWKIKKNKEEIKRYHEESYYLITKVDYSDVRHDTGRYGEYLIYKYLKEFENQGAKFLFNIYVPKKEEETTEIDVLMISSKGLFVFESKNYSGWIFGNDSQKYWYQTLPSGRSRSHKEKFYNPVFQNNTHVKYLKSLLGNVLPIYSIIAFSERCTLKNINVNNSNVEIINRNQVYNIVSSIYNDTPTEVLSNEQINNIYNKLYPYTQVDEVTKQKHIDNINTSIREKSKNEIPISNLDNISSVENNVVIEEANIKDDDHIEEHDKSKKDAVNENINKQEDNALICPECGAELLLRTAKHGEHSGENFYGCSNYPKCKYIKKI